VAIERAGVDICYYYYYIFTHTKGGYSGIGMRKVNMNGIVERSKCTNL